mgnify:CR=1 FL=1
MTKTELIAMTAEKTGMTKKDAEKAVAAVLDSISAELTAGNRVQLAGFGIFETKNREARTGRNPHTKETIQIPATRVPAFKASKTLKDAVAK